MAMESKLETPEPLRLSRQMDFQLRLIELHTRRTMIFTGILAAGLVGLPYLGLIYWGIRKLCGL